MGGWITFVWKSLRIFATERRARSIEPDLSNLFDACYPFYKTPWPHI